MSSGSSLPQWIARLPPNARRLFGWAAFLVTILTILPGTFAVLYVVLQPDTCGQLMNGYMSFICTPIGLGILKIVAAIIFFPLALMWFRFLTRLTNPRVEGADEDVISPVIGNIAFGSGSKDIGMWQVLLSGRLEEASRSSHNVVINGERVGFLSVYPFQKGWLKRGDFVHVVYQGLPLLRSIRVVVAYCDAASGTVHGASAWVYSMWIPLLAICMMVFADSKPWYGQSMLALCGALLIADLGYLSLMVRARSMLRSTIETGTRDVL